MRRTTILWGLLVSFGLVACDSATSPEASSEDSAATSGVTTVDAALARNSHLGIERAEFRDGFCSVALFAGGFTLYTGASTAVTTNSGNINYHCKGDILFGPGPPSRVLIEGVSFFDFSPADGPWIIEPCDIRITPGASGQMQVSCHVGPRGGQAVNPDA